MVSLSKLATRRQWISIGKGSLTYTLAFVLIFLRGFDDLIDFPIVLSSIILVAIAGQPGLSVGQCLDGGALGGAGVAVGAFFYWLLALLGHSPISQGFVFFAVVYLFALIKAQSMRYFAFALLGIIVSFSGIYTSILLGGVFSPAYLESYLKAYAWGFALVLGVNLLVFPHTAEAELRGILVSSLHHISTLSHLIAKTYVLEITDDEKVVRDDLNQRIRADYGFLSQKLAQTSLEVNYTRWSMQDYSGMVCRIRAMQLGLLTSYSSLVEMERLDPASLAAIKDNLVSTGSSKAFSKLRRGTDLAISDIVAELAVGSATYHSPAPGERSWEDFQESHPQETQSDGAPFRSRGATMSSPDPEAIRLRLNQVSDRLRKEVESDSTTVTPRISISITTPATPSGAPIVALDRPEFLRKTWTAFDGEQNAAIADLIAKGVTGDDELKLHQSGPSLHEQYARPSSKAWFAPTALRQRTTSTEKEKVQDDDLESVALDPSATSEGGAACSTAVARVFSFLFGMGQAVNELAELHEFIVPKNGVETRPKRLHVHLFERIRPATTKGSMSLAEAVASLQGHAFVKPRVTFWARVAQFEQLVRSETSISALKTAAAVSVFTVFLLAPSLTSFFVAYGLTGGLITIVVALSPTLGQTLLTFVLQILGTGFGTLYGLLILTIFRGVGGFYFNPYGIVCLVAVYSVPMCWIIYCRPMFFAGALLAMNATGILVVTQWVYREVPGQIRPDFDSPALRSGKALVGMSIALVIAGVFQVFILRTPARRMLRIKLSQLTFALASYNILLSTMGEAVVPLPSSNPPLPPPSAEVVSTVRAELVRREGQMQDSILSLMPLLKFGSAEFDFGRAFDVATLSRVVRSHQLILDRLRESRTAVGTEGFSQEIKDEFIAKLSPYRRQSKRFIRALFFVVGTSLATKLPLPSELPSMASTTRLLQHDALVLSHRLTRDTDGRRILKSDAFVRYWFYLVSYTSVSYHLESMETDLRLLFGDVEDNILRFQ